MLGLFCCSKITSKNLRYNFKSIFNNNIFSFSKIYCNENINRTLINYNKVNPHDKYFEILINKNFVKNTTRNSTNQFLSIHKKYISNYDFKTKTSSNKNENDKFYSRDKNQSYSYNSKKNFSKNFEENNYMNDKNNNYDSKSLYFKDNINSRSFNKIEDYSPGSKMNDKKDYKDNFYYKIDNNNYKIQNKKESSTNFSDSNEIDNYSNYDFSRSKYYIEKNLPETFKSKSEKIDLSIKDPNIKKIIKDEKTVLSFRQMNFLQEIYTILDKLEINSPTSIQTIAIPKILEKKNIFFASQTGMGKTLTYVLPIINELKLQELQLNERLTQPKRPRVLILAPSRELCQQIEEVIKLFVYDLPLVVESFYVGKSFGTEKKYTLKGVDILISTPDRFKNHWGKNNVYITQLTHLVVDELDTFLDAGYADFIYDLSEKLLNKDKNHSKNGLNEKSQDNYEEGKIPEDINFNENYEEKRKRDYFLNENIQTEKINEDKHLNLINDANNENRNLENGNESNSNFTNISAMKTMKKPKEFMKTQLIFISTTLTKSIERFLDSIFEEEIHRKQLSHSGESNFVKIIDKSTNHNLSNIKHEFLQVTDFDKFPTLLKILNDNKKILKQNFSIILFVNSIICARKTELYLAENGFETSCLHGEIPPLRRKFELEKFKKRKSKILVTTDLIARGLDFPFVYLVINFDFPNNVSDYIHRAGRTGRAGRKGFVISFFRKFNIDLIEEIKNSNRNNTPLQTEGSMFSKNNKENFISDKSSYKKKLTYGLINKSLKVRLNKSSENEKLSVIQKLKLRKERIDKMKANIIKERKERIKILDKKYNRKYRDTNKKNTYGNRWAKRK